MIDRHDLESQEEKILASYAVKSAQSQGRKVKEAEDDYRTCFQRDRDRVIHSKAFRRLNGKTQVFIVGYGDHYRSRLTHSMEVAQFGRDIARMLNLNQDLAEAIGLAHDLGHTPFGHAGQDAMNEKMEQFGSRFEHNEQSFRVVDVLEKKSHVYPGLNLSFEILDGLLKHRTRYDRPKAFDHFMPSLEAQVVNVADEIAYQSHDIDDGLRSGVLNLDSLLELSICEVARELIQKSDTIAIKRRHLLSSVMSLLVNDLAEQTELLLKEKNIQQLDHIYKTPEQLAQFSPRVSKMGAELKDYLYQNFYHAPEVTRYNEQGMVVIATLFDHFYGDSDRLPETYQLRLKNEVKHEVVKDYIAGMTDSFALKIYDSLL